MSGSGAAAGSHRGDDFVQDATHGPAPPPTGAGPRARDRPRACGTLANRLRASSRVRRSSSPATARGPRSGRRRTPRPPRSRSCSPADPRQRGAEQHRPAHRFQAAPAQSEIGSEGPAQQPQLRQTHGGGCRHRRLHVRLLADAVLVCALGTAGRERGAAGVEPEHAHTGQSGQPPRRLARMWLSVVPRAPWRGSGSPAVEQANQSAVTTPPASKQSRVDTASTSLLAGNHGTVATTGLAPLPTCRW